MQYCKVINKLYFLLNELHSNKDNYCIQYFTCTDDTNSSISKSPLDTPLTSSTTTVHQQSTTTNDQQYFSKVCNFFLLQQQQQQEHFQRPLSTIDKDRIYYTYFHYVILIQSVCYDSLGFETNSTDFCMIIVSRKVVD